MKGRPAESTAGVGSIGLLIAVVLGVDDPNLIAVLGAAVGLIPAAVTLLVSAGGLRGVFRSLWRGKAQQDGLTLLEVLVVLLIVLVVLMLVGIAR